MTAAYLHYAVVAEVADCESKVASTFLEGEPDQPSAQSYTPLSYDRHAADAIAEVVQGAGTERAQQMTEALGLEPAPEH
jgi:hypothetical protein